MTRDFVKPIAVVALAALAIPGLPSPTLAQDRDARERIAALTSSDAVARAMAACELGRMRAADVRPARDALLALGRVIDSADLDMEPSALAALLRRALLSRDRR